MFKLLKILVIFILLLTVVLVGLFVASIESKPLFSVNSSHQVDQAESVKQLMKELSHSIQDRESKQTITITQDQLNSLVGFAQRAHKPLQGMVDITPAATSILISYRLPIGKYMNIDVMLLPGSGVTVEHVEIGPFAIPGELALSTLVTLANWYTQSDIASQFVQQVENVTMHPRKIRLAVRPLDEFLKELNNIKQGVGGASDEELRLRTAYYLRNLSELEISNKSRPQSLAKYIGPLFTWAKQRSNFETAPLENEAAIMALAIYAGHHRFANLVGDVQPVKGEVALPLAKPMLRYRSDLNQHFIFSAAIKLLSEQGVSMAIGEFKELMDRSKDGSGYSFVDLAADFAGVEFAVSATDPVQARVVQIILAGNFSERAFFPSIKGLPEGLKKAAFEAKFGQVDSPKYNVMVAEIKRRIAALPIHN